MEFTDEMLALIKKILTEKFPGLWVVTLSSAGKALMFSYQKTPRTQIGLMFFPVHEIKHARGVDEIIDIVGRKLGSMVLRTKEEITMEKLLDS